MKLPPVTLALALSLAAGFATMRLAMGPIDAEAGSRMQAAASACQGYEMLHVLLRSARDAEEFRHNGRCLEIVGQR